MLITKTAKDVADNFDAEILAFFGSEEQVKAYAHLFVIEHYPVEITPFTPLEGEGNYFGYRAETQIRIRPKTLAELEAEKNV
jgi:hypothetical protein